MSSFGACDALLWDHDSRNHVFLKFICGSLVESKIKKMMGKKHTLKYEVSRMGTPLGVNSRVLEWVRDMIVEP